MEAPSDANADGSGRHRPDGRQVDQPRHLKEPLKRDDACLAVKTIPVRRLGASSAECRGG